MHLLNLTFVQFLALAGAVSAVAVALYLLDRSRRRVVVSTLRFWVAAEQPAEAARRRRIQQPWSLVLQLASMALLLLAVAQLRIGAPGRPGRDHVVVLDTSAWMAARSGDRTLMDLARERARSYVRTLPARDRVMLVRADSLATPATAFETDRRKVEAAIRASNPGSTALNINQALAFARHIQAQEDRRAGEIAFIGAGRSDESEEGAVPPPRNLRALLVPDTLENCGLRKVGARRSVADPDLWEIYVAAHNYGTSAREVTVSLDFGATASAGRIPVGARRLTLPAAGDAEAAFQYRGSSAGVLGVRLSPGDAFPDDDHAALDLPSQPVLRVTLYSNEPELFGPILAATRRIAAVYRKPEQYRADDRGLVILDRFVPPRPPSADSVWIDPPGSGSPIPIKQTIDDAPLVRWDRGHLLAAGVRARDVRLERASVFAVSAGDRPIGEVDAGPVIVARPGKPNIVVFGFHPALSGMRYELATPLLFANLMRWVAPEVFRRSEIAAGTAGTIRLDLDEHTAPADLKVTSGGAALPFTVRGQTLDFFAGSPGTVEVEAGDRDYVFSLTLPQVGGPRWRPPAGVRQGMPRFARFAEPASDLWPWLALLGGAGLVLEWLLFARNRGRRRRIERAPVSRRPAEVGR